jgi:hypothetical protein
VPSLFKVAQQYSQKCITGTSLLISAIVISPP